MASLFDTFEISADLVAHQGGVLHRVRRRSDGTQALLWRSAGAAGRERSLLQILSETGAVPVPGAIFPEEGGEALVLSWFPGISLESHRKTAEWTLDRVLSLGCELARTLDRVHRAGVLHRNLNPQTILVDPQTGAVRLFDFSLAALASEEGNGPGASAVRDPAYMAPEQTGRTDRRTDARTDYYALGMILYTLVSGEPAFPHLGMRESIHAHLAKVPPTPGSIGKSPLAEGCPAPLAAVILKLLEKGPQRRYQSLTGLLADLERCRRDWAEKRQLQPFRLGTDDQADQLRLPRRTVGRETERTILEQAYRRAASGAREVLLLRGPSGIGKTTLVQEISGWAAADEGLFLSGPFEQRSADQPYTGFVALMQDFCRQVGASPKPALWAGRIREALRENVNVLSSLVPELAQLVGTVSRPNPLAPKETEDRLLFSWRTFFRSIGPERGRPLVIFFEDLQWMDKASASLLLSLIRGLDGILLVLTSRETTEGPQRAEEFLAAIEAQLTRSPLDLGPLTPSAVTQLLSECLGASAQPMESLGAVLWDKTGGNPFFLIQLLTNLHREGRLVYDPAQRGWTWDILALGRMGISPHVADLLASNLQSVEPGSRFLLGAAACLGAEFRIDDLEVAVPLEAGDLAPRLRDLVEARYLAPVDDAYRLLRTGDLGDLATPNSGRLRFVHARIYQAATGLVTPEDQRLVHRRLALHMAGAGRTVEAAIHHLAAGTEPEPDLAPVFLEAANQMRAASALDQALTFLRQAHACLLRGTPPAAVERPVISLLAETAFLCRDVELGESASRRWAELLPEGPDQAAVFLMQMDAFRFLGQMPTAMERGRLALRSLGYRLSLRPSATAVAGALVGFLAKASDKGLGRWAAREGQVPDQVQKTIRTLGRFLIPAFMTGNGELFALSTLKAADLALRHPPCAESAGAFANLAILLSGMGRHKQAFDFASEALRRETEAPNPKTGPAVHSAYTLFCLPWNRPWSEFPSAARRTAHIAVTSGDLFILANQLCFGTIFRNYPHLDNAIAEGEKALGEVAATGHDDAWTGTKVALQRWKSLAGRLPSDLDFSEDDFNAAEAVARWKARGNQSGPATYHLFRTEVLVLLNEWEKAWDESREAVRFRPALAGSAYMADACLWDFLLGVEFARHPVRGPQARKLMAAERARMRGWAQTCPENFLLLATLMEAETAQTSGRTEEARRLFTQVLALVPREEIPRNRALALERAARFHRFHGDPVFADYLLADAYRAYSAWGAVTKTKQMDRDYRGITTPRPSGPAGGPATVDLESLARITQAVAREMDPTRLLEVVVPAVVENVGAQTGWLLTDRGGSWTVVARADAVDGCQVFPAARSPEDEGIPPQLVTRNLNQEPGLVISQAAEDPRWPGLPEGHRREVVSVLVLPFSAPGNPPTALWYLENNLFEGAFTAQRLETLRLLSGQIAIALDNARIYGQLQELNRDLEKKVHDRTEVIEERNRQLEGSLAYAGILQRALLPGAWKAGLADACLVWQPRDPVGGDLFWSRPQGEGRLIALVDCTGHGIPGALLTMIVHGLLEEAFHATAPGDLTRLIRTVNRRFRDLLGQQRPGGESNDGFDLGVLWWSRAEGTIRFAGNRIGLIRQNKTGTVWVAGEKESLGYPGTPDPCPVKVHEADLAAGDRYYLSTDGIQTQVGGPAGIAFGRDRLLQFLTQTSSAGMEDQAAALVSKILEYRGLHPQQDDITIVGVQPE